ncbi:YccF domain-containing protein [Haloplasma contractile]|uniref:Cobaltochelatase CobN protein n=1 Tax=Haloplasma contractile SSD-17B TaxID=1033810 RepID=U2FKB5_9MOLU|nr:YccF domain-containing protein [Haloplasma contractile]ERJ13255.1 cobaltochelatase CobN protein [Haloplasma contractile SSD-17B]
MKFLGNLLWFLFGGAVYSIIWYLIGILYCITIIGIPFGKQAFKLGKLTFTPFGKKLEKTSSGAGSTIANIIWFIFGGIELAIFYFITAILSYITIIGIPFGKQYMKLAKLSIAPFGVKVTK